MNKIGSPQTSQKSCNNLEGSVEESLNRSQREENLSQRNQDQEEQMSALEVRHIADNVSQASSTAKNQRKERMVRKK